MAGATSPIFHHGIWEVQFLIQSIFLVLSAVNVWSSVPPSQELHLAISSFCDALVLSLILNYKYIQLLFLVAILHFEPKDRPYHEHVSPVDYCRMFEVLTVVPKWSSIVRSKSMLGLLALAEAAYFILCITGCVKSSQCFDTPLDCRLFESMLWTWGSCRNISFSYVPHQIPAPTFSSFTVREKNFKEGKSVQHMLSKTIWFSQTKWENRKFGSLLSTTYGIASELWFWGSSVMYCVERTQCLEDFKQLIKALFSIGRKFLSIFMHFVWNRGTPVHSIRHFIQSVCTDMYWTYHSVFWMHFSVSVV